MNRKRDSESNREHQTESDKIEHSFNGIVIEQRVTDGFINGTAMCAAHGKKVSYWLRNDETLALFLALADDLNIEIKVENSQLSDIARLSALKYSQMFPGLVTTRNGSPENGGGVWLHPDLAIQLAQWCNKPFAIQVSRWVREWMTVAYSQAEQQRKQHEAESETRKLLGVFVSEVPPCLR